jgi:glycosyltransferase involved in cell wall biosynthesis
LQHADVGIIPFKVTPLIESVSPLKLYEYMACGLPVVASRWRELEAINSPARLASSSEEFLRLLHETLARLSDLKKQQFREFACRNSWQARGESVLKIFAGAR